VADGKRAAHGILQAHDLTPAEVFHA
jgi:hypothetical protein